MNKISEIDKKALKILNNMHWSPSGWKVLQEASKDDYKYAKQAGYLFESLNISHDELINQIIKIQNELNQLDITNAFLSSLSTRRLDYRSALGSFAFIRLFPNHNFSTDKKYCPICGWFENKSFTHEINVLNFERFKWGGVRHLDPLFSLFDLQQFLKLEIPNPSKNDINIIKEIVTTIENVPKKTTSAELQKHISKIFKSNKSERDVLIGIFGICGILETKNNPGYYKEFIKYENRESPSRRFVDMSYPACWWEGKNGINKTALNHFFWICIIILLFKQSN